MIYKQKSKIYRKIKSHLWKCMHTLLDQYVYCNSITAKRQNNWRDKNLYTYKRVDKKLMLIYIHINIDILYMQINIYI